MPFNGIDGSVKIVEPVVNNALLGATWNIDANGRVYNSPTPGSELLTNPGFENWSSATNADNWTEAVTGTSTINQESTIKFAGNYSARLDIDGSESIANILQNAASPVGSWNRVIVYSRVSDTTGNPQGRITTNYNTQLSLTTSFQQFTQVFRAAANPTSLQLLRSASSAGKSIYYDDASVKTLTLNTLFASINTASNNPQLASKIYNYLSGTQIGLFSNLDNTTSPANFIIAYMQGSSILLDKCVAGTYTNLLSVAFTFVADAKLELQRVGGNIWQVKYNDILLGEREIADSGIINNTIHGLFSTSPQNLFSDIVI